MTTNNENGKATVLLVFLMGVVVIAVVIGSAYQKESTVQIIGFGSVVIASLVQMLRAELAKVEVAQKVEQVAVEAKEVAVRVEKVAQNHEKVSGMTVEKLDGVVKDMAEVKTDVADVKHATNGMKKQLEEAAYARGTKDEKDRESREHK